jgi:hypothetical protein
VAKQLRWRAVSATPELHGPIDERLLDVRIPAELAFSPDGSRVAFALHATVADIGSHPPSDLFLVGRDSLEPVRIIGGAWSDRSPAWSPDGSQLWPSCPIGSPGAPTPVHDGLRRRAGARGGPDWHR